MSRHQRTHLKTMTVAGEELTIYVNDAGHFEAYVDEDFITRTTLKELETELRKVDRASKVSIELPVSLVKPAQFSENGRETDETDKDYPDIQAATIRGVHASQNRLLIYNNAGEKEQLGHRWHEPHILRRLTDDEVIQLNVLRQVASDAIKALNDFISERKVDPRAALAEARAAKKKK